MASTGTYYAIKTNSRNGTLYVTAPSGWARHHRSGEIVRDGTCPRKSSPELGHEPYWFTSRKYAEQQAAKLIDAKIIEWALSVPDEW